MFLIRLNGTFQGDEKAMEDMLNNLYKENQERVESRGSKGESTKDSLKFPNSVRLADSFKDLVDICDYSEPTDAVEEQEKAFKKLKKENKELKQENEELKKENQGIQNKVIRLLDFVEIKQCVTRTEIKKWWNDD